MKLTRLKNRIVDNMIKYNLYYNNRKINKRALNESELELVKKHKIVNKFNDSTGNLEEIPTDKIQIIKCYIL